MRSDLKAFDANLERSRVKGSTLSKNGYLELSLIIQQNNIYLYPLWYYSAFLEGEFLLIPNLSYSHADLVL